MSDMRTAQDQQVLITRIFDAPRGPYTHSAHAEAGWNAAFAKLDALLT